MLINCFLFLLGEIIREHQELDPEHRGERDGGRGANAAREQMRAGREAAGDEGAG